MEGILFKVNVPEGEERDNMYKALAASPNQKESYRIVREAQEKWNKKHEEVV